jgi:AcrR family transcriptional regulator
MGLDGTYERIASVATAVMLADGVKKMSLADIAFKAGITRVTVYRYFGDKRGLVRAVCLRIAAYFQKAAEEGPNDSTHDIDLRLNQLGESLRALPPGNLLARIEEISHLYPDVHEEFRSTRQNAIDRIFLQALTIAMREHTLRDGLNPQVLKAIFWSSVIGLIENPTIISSNVSLSEVFATVTEVFRRGILKDSSEYVGMGQASVEQVVGLNNHD